MNTEVKNLMFDYAMNKEIFDSEQNRVISKAEANEAIRKVVFEKLGLNEKSTEKQIKRALKSPAGVEFFEVTEEIIDKILVSGWADNEFFNSFVETRNIADGDRTDFWTDENDKLILNVAKVSGDHHDYTIQRLGQGETFTVPMSNYAVKVGGDMRMFLAGRQDWSQLVAKIAQAFTKKIQDELYTEFMNAAAKVTPTSQFNKTGTLTAAVKDTFDTLLSDVAMANDSEVVIMGTKTALKKLNALAGGSNGTVNWVANSQKEAIAANGILGDYEGTALIEIPQRFANNDVATKLVDSGKLLIMPVVDYKPVKFIDGGESTLEVSEYGATADDMDTFEVQRKMGISTIITRYFGTWTF